MISAPTEFRQLLDAAPDPMIVVDELGLMTAINLEAERFFGWAEEEMLGEPMSRCFPARFHRLLDADLETNGGSTNGGSPTASKTGVSVSRFARRRGGTAVPARPGGRAAGG